MPVAAGDGWRVDGRWRDNVGEDIWFPSSAAARTGSRADGRLFDPRAASRISGRYIRWQARYVASRRSAAWDRQQSPDAGWRAQTTCIRGAAAVREAPARSRASISTRRSTADRSSAGGRV